MPKAREGSRVSISTTPPVKPPNRAETLESLTEIAPIRPESSQIVWGVAPATSLKSNGGVSPVSSCELTPMPSIRNRLS